MLVLWVILWRSLARCAHFRALRLSGSVEYAAVAMPVGNGLNKAMFEIDERMLFVAVSGVHSFC